MSYHEKISLFITLKSSHLYDGDFLYISRACFGFSASSIPVHSLYFFPLNVRNLSQRSLYGIVLWVVFSLIAICHVNTSILKLEYLDSWVRVYEWWIYSHVREMGNKKSYKLYIRLWWLLYFHCGGIRIYPLYHFYSKVKRKYTFYCGFWNIIRLSSALRFTSHDNTFHHAFLHQREWRYSPFFFTSAYHFGQLYRNETSADCHSVWRSGKSIITSRTNGSMYSFSRFSAVV